MPHHRHHDAARRRAVAGLVSVVYFVVVCSAIVAARQVAEYAVVPQDVLTVTVFEQNELSGKYAVDSDGTIAFPMVGRLRVGGLTTRDVERELRRHLADGYFKNPQVSVSVEPFRVQQVFVIGEVRSPGAFPLNGGMTVMEALARAGSTTPEASNEALIVRSGSPGAAVASVSAGTTAVPPAPVGDDEAGVRRVDLGRLSSGVLSENVALQSGDTVVVRRVEMVFVLGQVRAPGPYPARAGTTVLQAIAMAGGATDRGSTGRVRISRLENGQSREIKAELGDVIRPGDTVIVLERIL